MRAGTLADLLSASSGMPACWLRLGPGSGPPESNFPTSLLRLDAHAATGDVLCLEAVRHAASGGRLAASQPRVLVSCEYGGTASAAILARRTA